MAALSKRVLFWTPRLLSIAYIIFLSLFALDVFGEGYSFWKACLALVIHLIPAFALTVALILAWRWEWVGAAVYATAGTVYVITVLPLRMAPAVKFSWIVTIAGPAFLLATMFLLNWWKRGELQASGPGQNRHGS